VSAVEWTASLSMAELPVNRAAANLEAANLEAAIAAWPASAA